MVPLSVAIITKNEAANLARCISSVRDLAAEIVVVDSGSTDGTGDLARSLGARVVHHEFEGHIEQKNAALDLCTHDHVLSLDADEALDERLRQSVRMTLGAWTFDAYRMNRLTQYCGSWIRHGGWYPDVKVRLFRRSKGRWTGINPHDEFRLTDRSSRIGVLEGDILHYSYESIADHLRQIDYFTGITAGEYHALGRGAPLWKLLVSPPVRFLRDYCFRGGFLDGIDGLIIAVLSSYAVFIKYARVRHLSRGEKNT